MFPSQLSTWSKTINEDTADFNTPPNELAKTFIPIKPNTKNPFKEPHEKSPERDVDRPPAYNLYQGPPFSFFNLYVHIPNFPSSAYIQQPPAAISERLELSPTRPSLEAPKIWKDPPSSSLPSETDKPIQDKLAEFFEWLSKTNPMIVEQFESLLKIL